MLTRRPTPRILQQQPRGDSAAQQQQQSGSSDFQPQAGSGGDKKQQMGEGSYEGTREYNKRTQDYLEKADVEKDAEAAKPRSEQEAREMEQAEKEGRSHAKK